MLGNKVANVQKEACYLVMGTLHFAQLDENDQVIGGYEPVGTLSELSFAPENEKIERKEYQSGKNNTVCENIISTDVAVSMIFHDFTPENMERFIFGTLTNNAAGSAFEDTINVYLGRSNKLTKLATDTTAITVVDTDTGLITYEEGKNYEISNGSIYVYTDAEQTAKGAANNITDGESVDITYDSVEFDSIKSFTQTSIKVAAYFEGVNEAQGGKPITFDIPKMSIDPAEFNVLSPEEYNEATVAGTLLVAKGNDYIYEVKMAK